MSSIEMTIDQLAARVGMTVRNVRAYATRGLLPPPRLVGRKGYYGDEHAARLQLIRDLVDRGYTLGAVEKALSSNKEMPATHAIDLLALLANPVSQSNEPEVMTTRSLAGLAGLQDQPEVVELLKRELIERDLAKDIDDDTLRILQPALVRAGAQAISIGLDPHTVLDLFHSLRKDLEQVAQVFVGAAREELWRPFAERGMPEDEWPTLLSSIEGIIPAAVQAVAAAFRHQLNLAIEQGVADELSALSEEQVRQLFGSE